MRIPCRNGIGRRLDLLLLLALAVELAACNQPSGQGCLDVHALTLVLPGLPASWASVDGLMFRVEWRDERGVRQSACAAPGSSLEVEFVRGLAQEVLAVPVLRGRALRPAGARYPADLEAGADGGLGPARLQLGWKGGWLASLSRRLAAGGHDPGAFNLARLKETLDGSDVDPWVLEPGEAARSLVAGSFRSSCVSEPRRFAVILPGSGPWLSESALAPQPVQGDDGRWTVELAEGVSLVLGPDTVLALGVDPSGKASSVVLR